MTVKHLISRWACVVVLGMMGSVQAAESYRFGVVPQFEQRKLFAIWKPVIDELQKLTGIELNLVATLTVPDFEREIAAGSYDFVYANPFHILRESTRQGYIPLVRDEEPLRGILVVRRDSEARTPADLNGKTLAIPSFNALGASLLMRADLEQIHKVTMTPLNVKTHSSVYLHVVNGLTAAGGGVEKTLQEQDPAVRNALRVLYTTRELPPHPVAAHPRVHESARKKIQQAFLELGRTEAGRQLLSDIPIARIVPTAIQDYQPMSKWGLDKYWVNQ